VPQSKRALVVEFSEEHMSIFTTNLPGDGSAYGIRRGEGPRFLCGGMVVSQYARGQDTGNGFSLSLLTGGEGAGLPILRHSGAQVSLFVVDGVLELMIGDQALRLEKGDYASIPEGTTYGYRMERFRNVVLSFQSGGESGALFEVLGQPYKGFVQPESGADGVAGISERGPIAGCDTDVIAAFPEAFEVTVQTTRALPEGKSAFSLRAGEGDRFVVADQMFTYLSKNAHSDGRFFALMCEGPAGQMIPPHYHEQHTECFFCLEGSMTMIAGDETINIGPGDFVHVTPGTVHAYQLNSNYTQMIGFLTPGVFEKFFAILGDPYAPKVYPQEPRPFEFGRVLARLDELDMVPVGKPQS
jgi:quercetin 2,3-dioxygenase